jgi:acetyltransferase-like isoleucine patch superfamily enzyme
MKSGEHMTVGRFSYGKPKVWTFPSGAHLTIGSFCSIAEEVSILLGGNHRAAAATTFPLDALFDKDGLPPSETSRGDVAIGNDVWIGYGATILSGVTIGDGAIIGARAVVSRDVAPYEIVAGNPARHIRYRFEAQFIRDLLALRWWDWPIEKIREQAPWLMGALIAKEVLV